MDHPLQRLIWVLEDLTYYCRLLFGTDDQPRPETEGEDDVPHEQRRTRANTARVAAETALQPVCAKHIHPSHNPTPRAGKQKLQRWDECNLDELIGAARRSELVPTPVYASLGYVRDIGNIGSHARRDRLSALEVRALALHLRRIGLWYCEMQDVEVSFDAVQRELSERRGESELRGSALLWADHYWDDASRGPLDDYTTSRLETIADRLQVTKAQREAIRERYRRDVEGVTRQLLQFAARAQNGDDVNEDDVATISRLRVVACISEREAAELWKKHCAGVRLAVELDAPGWMKPSLEDRSRPRRSLSIPARTLLALAGQGVSPTDLDGMFRALNAPEAPRDERSQWLLARLLHHCARNDPDFARKYLIETEAAR